MENCCIIYFGGAKICDVTNLGGAIALLCSLVISSAVNKNAVLSYKVPQEMSRLYPNLNRGIVALVNKKQKKYIK
jgi:hypothetical protein